MRPVQRQPKRLPSDQGGGGRERGGGAPDRRGGFVHKGKEPESVRITNQFRDRRGMVYDFKCAGIGVSISIWAAPDDKTNWSAEAIAKLLPAPPVVSGNGASRDAALRVVADDWARRGSADGLPHLDWDAIRGALVTVRAI
jgi:hypothetical protein